ncbi:hypothetical protein NEUTE2DRAFT_154757 [Neurospora tetrasperma FGSC 2509]|nr:hypothetical protein NEUTE2DRAFT_154757 [Neurospora tetrasperma FGSC 2509]
MDANLTVVPDDAACISLAALTNSGDPTHHNCNTYGKPSRWRKETRCPSINPYSAALLHGFHGNAVGVGGSCLLNSSMICCSGRLRKDHLPPDEFQLHVCLSVSHHQQQHQNATVPGLVTRQESLTPEYLLRPPQAPAGPAQAWPSGTAHFTKSIKASLIVYSNMGRDSLVSFCTPPPY